MGIVAKPSAEFVAAVLGTWLTGGVAVPLALSYPEAELLYVMKDSVSTRPPYLVEYHLMYIIGSFDLMYNFSVSFPVPEARYLVLEKRSYCGICHCPTEVKPLCIRLL